MRIGIAKDRARDMDAPFVPISTQQDLDRLLAASTEHPVVLFKHDDACSISVRAYWDLAAVPGEISLIDVEQHHELSQSVAAQLGVRHESPQVIVVRDRQPVYAASHWNISRDAVTRAADWEEVSTDDERDASTD